VGSGRPTLSVRRRPLVVPEPGQRVRLRAGCGQWRGSFRAVSESYTDEVGEIVVWVAEEGEYREAVREGRRPVALPWPLRQIEVVSLLEDGEERTREAQERAEPRSSTPGAQEGAEPRSWWRRVFGG
jgi:hypothetical protein